MKLFLVLNDVGGAHELESTLAICSNYELALIEKDRLGAAGFTVGGIIEWELDKPGLEALL